MTRQAGCARLLAVLAGLLWAVLSCIPAAAQEFSLHAGAAPGEALVRVDALPRAEGDPYRLQAELPGGKLLDLPRPFAEAQQLYRLKDPALVPGTQVRLRYLTTAAGKVIAGDWTAAQAIPQADPVADAGRKPGQKGSPARFGAGDIRIEADPETSYGLRVMITRLPDPGDRPIAGIRLRRGFYTLPVVLPPEPGIWHRAAFPPGTTKLVAGRPEPVAAAAVSAAGTGGWSAPETVVLAWHGAPRAPDPFRPSHWMIRPAGWAGTAVIDFAGLPDLAGGTGAAVEARSAPAGPDLDPGDWGPWQKIGAPGTGPLLLGGLGEGRRMVQLRLVTSEGPGPASVPKLVAPRNLAPPASAVLGDLNPAGTGRIRIPAGSRPETVSAGRTGDWRTEPGPAGAGWDYLVPARDAADLPAEVAIGLGGGRSLEVRRETATFAADTAADIAAFLRLPAARKSGSTLLAGPEWIDLTGPEIPFAEAFAGLSAPVTLRPREPEAGTLVSTWVVQSADRGTVSGNLVIRGMEFYAPEALALLRGRGKIDILELNRGPGRFANIRLEDCKVRSDAMPGRLGWRHDAGSRAIEMTGVAQSAVTGCEVSHVVYGIAAGSEDALVRGNEVHHMIADPLNMFFSAGTARQPVRVRNVVLEDNTFHDYMGDAYSLHGDATHVWMFGGRAGAHTSIEGFRYRGNVSFPGEEGLRAPPRLPPGYDVVPVTADLRVGQQHERRILRVDASAGPVTVTLPAAEETIDRRNGPPDGIRLAVQKADEGPNPVIVAGPGLEGAADGRIVLRRPWTAVSLAGRHGAGWRVSIPVPAYQGLFFDGNDVVFADAQIEGNILWGMAPSQILPRNRPQAGVHVHHNTLLTPFPGDRDGDGIYNGRTDGATRSNGRIQLGAWDNDVSVWGNIASAVSAAPNGPKETPPNIWGNALMSWGDPASLVAQFPGARPAVPGQPETLVWFPRSREEAIDLARPGRDTALARLGQGAVGPDPSADWWNFGTGMRQGAGDPPLALDRLYPVPGDEGVPAHVPALEIALTRPAGPGEGTIVLRRGDGGEAARWPLGQAPGAVRREGPRLVLPLAAPLEPGQVYTVAVPDGAVEDIFGARLPAIPAAWSFAVAADGAVNLLGSADPRDPWWGAGGWQEGPEIGGVATWQRAGKGGARLRLDSRRFGTLLREGPLVLRFDYGNMVAKGPRSRVQLFGEEDRTGAEIDWNTVQPGQAVQIAPGLSAARRDAGADYGLPPGRVFTAELFWDPPPGLKRVVIDLLDGVPAGGGALMARLMVHRGTEGGLTWSAP